MSSEYEINVVRFPNRNQGFNAYVIRFQTRAAFNTEASLNVLLQYSSVSDQFSTNIRFRYNFREGNDLWLVYNQNLNIYRDDEKPRELLTKRRNTVNKVYPYLWYIVHKYLNSAIFDRHIPTPCSILFQQIDMDRPVFCA